jgi:hypothetical protein
MVTQLGKVTALSGPVLPYQQLLESPRRQLRQGGQKRPDGQIRSIGGPIKHVSMSVRHIDSPHLNPRGRRGRLDCLNSAKKWPIRHVLE